MEVRMAGDRRKPKSEEDQKMEKIDMSGLSLNILPNPSVNVTLIGHLDLSNNNLEVLNISSDRSHLICHTKGC